LPLNRSVLAPCPSGRKLLCLSFRFFFLGPSLVSFTVFVGFEIVCGALPLCRRRPPKVTHESHLRTPSWFFPRHLPQFATFSFLCPLLPLSPFFLPSPQLPMCLGTIGQEDIVFCVFDGGRSQLGGVPLSCSSAFFGSVPLFVISMPS